MPRWAGDLAAKHRSFQISIHHVVTPAQEQHVQCQEAILTMRMEVSFRVRTCISTTVVHVPSNTPSAPFFNNFILSSPQTFPSTVSVLVSAHAVAYRTAKQKIIYHRRHLPILRQLIGHVPVCETPVQPVLRSTYANKHAGRIEVGTERRPDSLAQFQSASLCAHR